MTEEVCFLVEKARDGDQDAVGRLFELYRLRVVRFCLSFARVGQADAHDVTQEVFMRAFNGIGRLREVKSFESWLLAIARKRCLTFLSRAKKRRDQMHRLHDEVGVRAVGNERDSRMRRIERKMVAEEIERLPDSALKEAGRRFYLGGEDTAQIAAALDAPVSSVTTWLSRFRGKIRKRLIARVLTLRGHGGVSQ
ncbi:MAG TPA: sigma-70 family RNA polymerase sigma factor [Myxococcota bacterium]|nr:sigma-70 family RNA polymerase sigma factor [Myxococcota bacterium]